MLLYNYEIYHHFRLIYVIIKEYICYLNNIMELSSFENTNIFSNTIPVLLESQDNYDTNMFQNINDYHDSNNNMFSNLKKIFKDEHERVFSEYIENNTVIDMSKRINSEIQHVEYNSDKYLEDLEKETDVSKRDTIIALNDKLNMDLHQFEDSIRTIRLHYTKINIATFKLEYDIINILKKYDSYHSNMKEIYKNLNKFENIDECLMKIDKELMDYIIEYFNKENLKEKVKIYKGNIREINSLKEYLNKINGISFVPYCQICMTSIIDTVIIPCGHTFCNDCLGKNEDVDIKKCFICREEITKTTKLFIN